MKKQNLLWGLSVTFCVLLVLSNIIANRLFDLFGLTLPSAVIVFPITYIIGDIVTEVFGFKITRKLIVAALLLNIVFAGFGYLASILPAVPIGNEEAFSTVFAVAPRTAAASIIGFFVGSLANALVMTRLKNRAKNKQKKTGLFARIIGSTIVGEALDTVIFITLNFAFNLPWSAIFTMIAAQFAVKVIYEAAISPVTVGIISSKKVQRLLES
jgi:conserved hypothetical integral membrane protein